MLGDGQEITETDDSMEVDSAESNVMTQQRAENLLDGCYKGVSELRSQIQDVPKTVDFVMQAVNDSLETASRAIRREQDGIDNRGTWESIRSTYSYRVKSVSSRGVKTSKQKDNPPAEAVNGAKICAERFAKPVDDPADFAAYKNTRRSIAQKLLTATLKKIFEQAKKYSNNKTILEKTAGANNKNILQKTAEVITSAVGGAVEAVGGAVEALGRRLSNVSVSNMDTDRNNEEGSLVRRTLTRENGGSTPKRAKKDGHAAAAATEKEEEEEEKEEEEEEEEEDAKEEEGKGEEEEKEDQRRVIETARAIEDVEKENREGTGDMNPDWMRIEVNSTSGLLVGTERGSLVRCLHILTWMLPSNLTAKIPSQAFEHILTEAEKQTIRENPNMSEEEKILLIEETFEKFTIDEKVKKMLEILERPENDVWWLGLRTRVDANGVKRYTYSENVYLSKLLSDMLDCEQGAFIDLCDFGAFRTNAMIDAVLNTFVVRGHEKILKELESERMKIIVDEEDSFDFLIVEGQHGGTSLLNSFIESEKGWTVEKIHPKAFEDVKYNNLKNKDVSVFSELTRGFGSDEKYMSSTQGLYYAFRDKGEGEYEVRLLVVIISLCRLGHLQIWLTWDYVRLLALVNAAYFLHGKVPWNARNNPIFKAIGEQRSNGKDLYRPNIPPQIYAKEGVHPIAGAEVNPS